jgi:hypothetical protein
MSRTARVLYELRINSISLSTVNETNVVFSAELNSHMRYHKNKVMFFFKDRREILIYIFMSCRELLGLYINYESIP